MIYTTRTYYFTGFVIMLAILLLSPDIMALLRNEQQHQPSTIPIPANMPASCFVLSDEYDVDMPLDLPVYDSAAYHERQALGLPTALPDVQPYYGEKVVYLTFDDGPDAENTPAILALLQENHIKATFFITGAAAKHNPELVKQLFADGHAIGNHSYNHAYQELYPVVDSYIDQLQQTDDIIKDIIGVRPLITRAPGGTAGHFTPEYWDREKQAGYIDVSWNICVGDAETTDASADAIVERVASQLENKNLWNHTIVLLHDGAGHHETVDALPEIISLFQERGFTFRVVNLFTPPAW